MEGEERAVQRVEEGRECAEMRMDKEGGRVWRNGGEG